MLYRFTCLPPPPTYAQKTGATVLNDYINSNPVWRYYNIKHAALFWHNCVPPCYNSCRHAWLTRRWEKFKSRQPCWRGGRCKVSGAWLQSHSLWQLVRVQNREPCRQHWVPGAREVGHRKQGAVRPFEQPVPAFPNRSRPKQIQDLRVRNFRQSIVRSSWRVQCWGDISSSLGNIREFS